MTDSSIRDMALRYAEAGLSVIPTGKNKLPVSDLLPLDADGKPTWKPYQTQIADAETIRRFFANGANVAIVGGAVSGGLCILDFDEPRFYEAWRAAVGTLADGMVVQKTGKGYHVLFRCPNPGRSQKLAYVPDASEDSGRRAAIETKAGDTVTGAGVGYVLAAPSVHGETGRRYEVIAGDLTVIPALSQAQADALLSAARKLDECPYTRQQLEAQVKREANAETRAYPKDGESVIDAYNRATSIETILEAHGYRVKGMRAIRPGGAHLSITVREGKSFHHNSNDPLSDGYWHSAFDVFCQLKHGGDVKAAVRAAAESLGLKAERRTRLASPALQPYAPPDADPDFLPFNRTDLGNAERLAAKHGDHLKYVRAWGWLVWKGARWECDAGAAWRLAKDTVRGIYAEAAHGADEDEREAIAKWAVQSESEARISAMLTLAESERKIDMRPEVFDADPMLLNCANGTLDLRTGALLPHDPANYITRIANTEYNPDAHAPTWAAFLDRIFAGNAAMIDFIRRAVGYSLTGETGEQCLFFCYGTGANGKSTFLETIRALLGDYAQAAEFSTFLVRQGEPVRNDIARMVGRRFIEAIEADEGRRLNETVIKALSGGDTVTARYLYKEYFEYRPAFKLWLAANHKPTIRGTDHAIWRRIRLIPFTVTIPEKERDPKLPAKLRAELPGVLAWAVKGCLEWQASGLRTPAEVRDATDSYQAEQDVIAAFLDECCVVKPGAEAKAADLYAAYRVWAEASGEDVEKQRAFGLRLKERGLENARGTGGAFKWHGIGLRAKDE